MPKTSALETLFARIFRLSTEKEYLLRLQWLGKSRSWARPLSPSLLRIVAGSGLVLTCGLGFLAWETGQWTWKEARYHLASSRHQIHLSELRVIQSDVRNIESAVNDAFRQKQRMRALYGISYTNAAPDFGIGGQSFSSPEDSALSRGLHENLYHMELKGRQLRGKIDYTLRNFHQIEEFIDYRHNIWDHTPSVAPAPGNWTSRFGYRVHPVTRRYAMHRGLDINGNRWTPIHATASGVVRSSRRERGYGNLVVIDHGNGYQSRYAHLQRSLVQRGEIVKRFDVIGYMGSTGLATGVHVHYEVLRERRQVNPEKYILPVGLVVD